MREMREMTDPAQQESVIDLYQALAAITRAMLGAAHAEDWDLLVALESGCAAHVATLQREEQLLLLAEQPLSMQQRKASLIEQMLADDGELRRLIAARMAQLSNKVSSARTERKLSRAYGG
jgi:flagellar protein FliT